MADCGKRLQQVRDVITAAHKSCSVSEKLQFYDQWAAQYEKDVSVLEYEAPHLAALALASVCRLNRESKLVLDVACGTGRAAEELQRCGFNLFHGLDGSAGMLEVAQRKDLYQDLKQSMLGKEQLPYDSEKYDAVIIVGALSDGQVPVSVLPELLRVTKPGGLVCMTTRSNISNLSYKAELEEEMSWYKKWSSGRKPHQKRRSLRNRIISPESYTFIGKCQPPPLSYECTHTAILFYIFGYVLMNHHLITFLRAYSYKHICARNTQLIDDFNEFVHISIFSTHISSAHCIQSVRSHGSRMPYDVHASVMGCFPMNSIGNTCDPER
ncbi:methyltransferase-like protein 27 isoform X1 [Eleutherodactylus coqui]|uniref:methyltransferase-like protein 27 isoform X1 n=1 Tax=Eleutherodactylus coqui TaxID=57060 RepID=UPI0034622BA4